MAFTYEKDEQNIVTVTMDMDGRSANVLNEEFSQLWSDTMDKLENEKDLAGVILASAKKTFIAGGDLEMLFRQDNPRETFGLIEDAKARLRRIELLGKPVVAAINGAALGGGLEIALCCSHRIAFNSPKTKLGFPEVTLGILPGGGGVVRFSRLLGLEASLPYLMEGKQVRPDAAKEAGMIDDIASDHMEMFAKARKYILENPVMCQPWDKKGYKMPGGTAHHPKIAHKLAIAPAILRKKTIGNYPAPEAILSAAVEGSLVDFETASRIESRYFVELLTGKVAKNMINAFWFQLNEINSGASRPDDIPKTEVRKLGVLGSGLMGHGISYVAALSGIEVVMTDSTIENAKKGLGRIKTILEGGIKRGLISDGKMTEVLDLITVTDDYDKLEGCDLIIEAVFEDRALKGKVTGVAEKRMDSSGVFASNTSTIPITSLAEKSIRPEKFIGIHFFSPVHKMKLVEIIRGEKTSPETLAKAFDFVLKIRKIPIVVNDSRGFYTTRVFERYTLEGMALLAEGNSAESIESAGQKAGLPVGPLAVIDEINIGLAGHIREQTRGDLTKKGEKWLEGPWDKVIDIMIDEVKRLGRANGGGFYEYPENGKKYLWSDLKKYFPIGDSSLEQEEMIDRFLFAQSVETIRCYEEGVLTSVADANIGSIFGWGFAPFKGGTLQFVNDYGVKEFLERTKELARLYGDRFLPPQLLVDMADQGKIFN